MSNTLSKILIFATGAAVGSFVTWKVVKTKYDRLIQEEIDSVKEVFKRQCEDEPCEDANSDEDDEEEDDLCGNSEYVDMVSGLGYKSEVDAKKEATDVRRPFVISPEEFGESDDYIPDMETLYYHSDGVMTDEQGYVIEDVDDLVGLDAVNHFGEYEDHCVHVRNLKYGVDYEILRVNEPHQAEEE